MRQYFQKGTPVGFGKGVHSHVFFLDEVRGVGAASTDAGHTHEVMYQPEVLAQPEQTDEMGNVVMPAVEGQPGGWIVMPAADGHSHELVDIEIKRKRKKENDKDICAEVRELYAASSEIEGDSFKKAEESEKFYRGDQWDPEVKARLLDRDRAVITINWIEKYIDELLGYAAQNSTDIACTPTEDGDQRVADLLNVILKHVQAQTFYQREKQKVTRDVVIAGRGNYSLYVDFSEDLRGKIVVEALRWRDAKYGPHDKEDASDAEYAFKAKMFSLGTLKQRYPKKAKNIEKDFEMYVTSDIPKLQGWSGDQYNHPDKVMPFTLGGEQMVDIAKKEYRVLECWRRVWHKCPIIVEPETELFFNAFGWSEEDIEAARTIPLVTVIERTIPKIRITRIAGNTVLSDENPADLPTDEMFLVPVYAKKIDNDFWGKIESAKDAQRDFNKRASQGADILNRAAAYGWFYDATTFPDNEKEKFKRSASTPGFTVEVTDVNNPPKQVEGTKYPTEIVNQQAQSQENVRAIMNITPNDPGANTSAAAILQQQKTKLTGNEFIFENLRFAEIKVGRLLIKMIQRYYSPERILRIVRNQDAKKPVEMGGEPVAQFSDEDILYLLETSDLSNYDVEITESDQSPTAKLSTAIMLNEMAAKGVPVPATTLVRSYPIPEKQRNEILEDIAAQQQAQNQAASETARAEVTKTLVGQGIIPPEVRADYGLDSPGALPAPTSLSEGIPEGEAQIPTELPAQSEQASSPQQPPIVINNYMSSGRKRKVGRIVKDPTGASQVEIQEEPLEEAGMA